MKQAIKSILKSLGIYKGIYRFYIARERKKYETMDACSMDYQGLKLRFSTQDAYSKKWFFPRFGKGQIHEPGATRVFMDCIKEGDHIFDIGAHLGYFSCVSAALTKTGTVCAFEVDSNCIDLISRNVSLNQLNNARIFHLAVSNVSSYVSIPASNLPDPGTHIEHTKGQNYIEVPSITIDEFISQVNITPNFVKIDVEGAEYMVLQGMKELLKNEDLILLIEIHVKQLLKYYDTNYKDVLKFLSDHGYGFEIVESHRSKSGRLRHINFLDDLGGNEMILCRKAP